MPGSFRELEVARNAKIRAALTSSCLLEYILTNTGSTLIQATSDE